MTEAMQKCKATVSKRAMQKRVARYKQRTNAVQDSPESRSSSAASSAVSPVPKLSSPDCITFSSAKNEAILDSMPKWLSREKTESTLGKRSKRKELEMARHNFAQKSKTQYRKTKFKRVWKEATMELHANSTGPTGVEGNNE